MARRAIGAHGRNLAVCSKQWVIFARVLAPLAARSIYHLSGEARWSWEHSIAEMENTRWSITFRSLSARGARERIGKA